MAGQTGDAGRAGGKNGLVESQHDEREDSEQRSATPEWSYDRGIEANETTNPGPRQCDAQPPPTTRLSLSSVSTGS